MDRDVDNYFTAKIKAVRTSLRDTLLLIWKINHIKYEYFDTSLLRF